MTGHPAAALRVDAQFEQGFGTALSFARSGDWWAATTTNTTNIWHGDELVHTVRVSGHVGGRDRFSDDAATLEVGLYTIEVTSGETLGRADATAWLSDALGDTAADPEDYTAAYVVHVPQCARSVVLTSYQRPRGRDARRSSGGPRAQLLLVDALDGALIAGLLPDAGDFRLADASAGLIAAAGRRQMSAWRSATGDRVGAWSGDTLVDALAVAPESDRVATLHSDGTASIWTPTGDVLRTWQVHEGAGAAIVWAPSGAWIATGSHAGRVGVWDLTSSEPTLVGTFDAASVGGLGVPPEGDRLFVAEDVVDQGITILRVPD